MRIAIDVRSLMEGRTSGVEIYTIELIRALLRIAPQHSFHLFYNSFRPVVLPAFTGNVTLHGFKYPNKIFNTWQWAAAQPRWDKLVSADVFFLPNMRLLPVHPDTPYVVTAHDLSYARFPEFYSLRRRLWHRLMRPAKLMRAATQVVAVSQITADDVHAVYGVPKERITVVHSGVADTVPGPTRKNFTLPEHYLLYLGTLEPRKNVPSVIEAFSALADRIPHDLVVAGSPGWLTKDIDRAVAASKVRERIHLLGGVTEEEKLLLYEGAALFIYPSFYEGFGFPPLEALVAGTPVITSHNSALPEIVGKWATLIDPYNPTELAQVILENLRESKPVAPAIRAEIKDTYDWTQTAAQTLAVLERAARVS